MAIDVTKIHVGAVKIFANVTAPASGATPTLLPHTSGVPNVGSPVDLGATEGDCVFKYHAEKTEIFVEQYLGPVDVYVGSEMATLTFTMKEVNYTALKLAYDNIGNVDDGSKTLFWGGGGTSILAPTTQCVAFSSLRRDATTKFVIGVLYKSYSLKGFEAPFRKKGESMVSVEIHGLIDTSRTAGDQMFQFFREK